LQAYWQQCHQTGGTGAAQSPDSIKILAITFADQLAAVQITFAAACQQAAKQLQLDSEHMLLGSTVLAAAHLVSEPATWLCVIILAWQQMFGSVKKKQGKRGKGSRAGIEGVPQDVHPGAQIVREQLLQTQQAFASSLQSVIDAVNVRLKAPSKLQLAHATQTVLGDKQQHLAQALAGCFSQGDIHATLNAILVAQSLTLKRVKLQASVLVSAL